MCKITNVIKLRFIPSSILTYTFSYTYIAPYLPSTYYLVTYGSAHVGSRYIRYTSVCRPTPKMYATYCFLLQSTVCTVAGIIRYSYLYLTRLCIPLYLCVSCIRYYRILKYIFYNILPSFNYKYLHATHVHIGTQKYIYTIPSSYVRIEMYMQVQVLGSLPVYLARQQVAQVTSKRKCMYSLYPFEQLSDSIYVCMYLYVSVYKYTYVCRQVRYVYVLSSFLATQYLVPSTQLPT